MSETTWQKLKAVNVAEEKMVKQKGKFSYISWAMAWSRLCDFFPDATMEKHCNENGFPYFKDENGWCFTKVTVTVKGKSITEMLPVLNYTNKPIKDPNSDEVNTSLQRCLAKAIALHGLGVIIYSGEDLADIPDNLGMEEETANEKPTEKKPETSKAAPKPPQNEKDKLSAWASDVNETVENDSPYAKGKMFSDYKDKQIKALDSIKSVAGLEKWKAETLDWRRKMKTEAPKEKEELEAYFKIKKAQVLKHSRSQPIETHEEIPI